MLTTLLGTALALPVLNHSAPASLDAGVLAKNAGLRSIGRSLGGEPDCGCADWQFSVYPKWERLAASNEGYRCIGGCGGSPFVWHADGSMVEKITCWRSNDDIQGLRVKFFNDLNEYNAGITSGNDYTSITFAPGERLTGDIALTDNGVESDWRLGYIGFSTTAGQSFECGADHNTKHFFPSQESYLAGFFGKCGVEIDQLGVLLWQPIKKAEVINLSYQEAKGTPLVKPSTVWEYTYCNDLPTEQMSEGDTNTVSIATGTDACFTLKESFSFTETMSVTAEIPEVAKVGSETKISFGAEATQQLCVKTTKTETDQKTFGPFKLEPMTSKKFTLSQNMNYVQHLPFTATLEITFYTGETYRRPVSGQFDGVQVKQVHEGWGEYHTLNPGDCSA